MAERPATKTEKAMLELLAAAMEYRGPNNNINDRLFSGPKYRLLVAAKAYRDAVKERDAK